MLGEDPGPWDTAPTPTKQDLLQLLSPPHPTDCYMDLQGSPALLPTPPTMPLFPHVLDLLAPLEGSSRALPSTEGLDDFSDGDVLGPELDTLLDSLVSPLFSPEPPPAWAPPQSSSRPTAGGGMAPSLSRGRGGGGTGFGGRNAKLQYVQGGQCRGGGGGSWFPQGSGRAEAGGLACPSADRARPGHVRSLTPALHPAVPGPGRPAWQRCAQRAAPADTRVPRRDPAAATGGGWVHPRLQPPAPRLFWPRHGPLQEAGCLRAGCP